MKKSFGQNFLIDQIFLQKIIETIDINSEDIVVEIGSGSGLLTVLLAEKAKQVFAIEPERDVLKTLNIVLSHKKISNVEVICDSFLKTDLCKLSDKHFKIIGNIPYNLTSKILLKIFGEYDTPEKHLKQVKNVYLMLQREVAKRLVAKPHTKAYSPLSLLAQYFSEPKILFNVPPGAFSPAPKVESAFVCLNPRLNMPNIQDPALLRKIIKIAFQQRRKKIINSLQGLFSNKKEVEVKLQELNLNQNLRAEDLSFDQYLLLANSLGK